MSLKDFLFYQYNTEEMMLVCLNQNAQKAMIDMLSYYLSKDGTSDALVPNVPIKDPDVHKKLRTELQNYISTYSSDSTVLKSSFDNLCKLEDFVNNTKTRVYKDLCIGEFCHPDFEEIKNWNTFWNFCCDNILNVLLYLKENKAIDDSKFHHRRIEFERIIPEENKYFLFKKYHEAINYHYGSVNNIIDLDTNQNDRVEQITFNLQFTIDEVHGGTERTKRLDCLDKKTKVTFDDIHLTSPLTETIRHSVKNIFSDALGPFNKSRYKTISTGADTETITVIGKNKEHHRLSYEFIIKPTERGVISAHYESFRSEESLAVWKVHSDDIVKFVFDLLQIQVSVGKSSWSFRPTSIRTINFVNKKNRQKWTIEEMIVVDKVMVMAQEKFNKDVGDIYIRSMKSMWYKHTEKIIYEFQLVILSKGIKGVAEEVIPRAQELVLEIPKY